VKRALTWKKSSKREVAVFTGHSPHRRPATCQRCYHPENPEVASELTELGYPGDELMREAIQLAFNEVSLEAFQVDPAPQSTPAFLFCLALAMFQKANVLEVQTGRDKKEARIVDIFMPRRSL
jgi:hypothetical protein